MPVFAILIPRIRNPCKSKCILLDTTIIGGGSQDDIQLKCNGMIIHHSLCRMEFKSDHNCSVEDISWPKLKHFRHGNHLSHPSHNIANQILLKPFTNGGHALNQYEKVEMQNGDWIGFSSYISGKVDCERKHKFVGREPILWFMFVDVRNIESQNLGFSSYSNGHYYTPSGKPIFSVRILKYDPWTSVKISCDNQLIDLDIKIYRKYIDAFCPKKLPPVLADIIFKFSWGSIFEIMSCWIACHMPHPHCYVLYIYIYL